MSTGAILLLGAIAGVTIFLGLPVARLRGLTMNVRAGLSAFATGILVFLLWDVLSNAVDPIDSALHAHRLGPVQRPVRPRHPRLHRSAS